MHILLYKTCIYAYVYILCKIYAYFMQNILCNVYIDAYIDFFTQKMTEK